MHLLDDDLDLLRQLDGIDHRPCVRVRLNCECVAEARRGDDGVVARVIVDRVRVEIAAARFGLTRDLADATGRRALEVHVLEHVRDPHDVVGLIEVPGLDVGHDRDGACRPVPAYEESESVRQDGAMHARRRTAERGLPGGMRSGPNLRGGAPCGVTAAGIGHRTMRNSPASALPRTKLSASCVGMCTPVIESPRRASLSMNSLSERPANVPLASRIAETMSSHVPTYSRSSRTTRWVSASRLDVARSVSSAPNSSS